MSTSKLLHFDDKLAFEKLCDLKYTPLALKVDKVFDFHEIAQTILCGTGLSTDDVCTCTFSQFLQQIRFILVPSELAPLFLLASTNLRPSILRELLLDSDSYSTFLFTLGRSLRFRETHS